MSGNTRIICWELQSRLGLKECITKCDFIRVLQERIRLVVRVDVEEDRHVHLLSRVQSLLFKTEALDLIEICSSLERNDIVG